MKHLKLLNDPYQPLDIKLGSIITKLFRIKDKHLINVFLGAVRIVVLIVSRRFNNLYPMLHTTQGPAILPSVGHQFASRMRRTETALLRAGPCRVVWGFAQLFQLVEMIFSRPHP